MPTIDERNARALQSFDRMEPPEPATPKRSGYRNMRECDPRAELAELLEGIIASVTFTGDLDAYDRALRAVTEHAIATAQRQGWNLGSARMEADSIAADLYSRARGGR